MPKAMTNSITGSVQAHHNSKTKSHVVWMTELIVLVTEKKRANKIAQMHREAAALHHVQESKILALFFPSVFSCDWCDGYCQAIIWLRAKEYG